MFLWSHFARMMHWLVFLETFKPQESFFLWACVWMYNWVRIRCCPFRTGLHLPEESSLGVRAFQGLISFLKHVLNWLRVKQHLKFDSCFRQLWPSRTKSISLGTHQIGFCCTQRCVREQGVIICWFSAIVNRHMSITELGEKLRRATLLFNLLFSAFFLRDLFSTACKNCYWKYVIWLIGFLKADKDNASVRMVTQTIVTECVLFNSSTKQIEMELFPFLLIWATKVFPAGSLKVPICQNLWAITEPEILGYVELIKIVSVLYRARVRVNLYYDSNSLCNSLFKAKYLSNSFSDNFGVIFVVMGCPSPPPSRG